MKTSKLYILITIVITWWALASCSSQSKADIPRKNVSPEAIQKALADSEGLFKQREDLDKLRTAMNDQKLVMMELDASSRPKAKIENKDVRKVFIDFSDE